MSHRLNKNLRDYINTMRPMLDAGLTRLPPGDALARMRYEMAIGLCHTIETCTDELPADVVNEVKRLFQFVASQGHSEERVN